MSDNVLTITIGGKDDDIDVRDLLTIVKETVALLRELDKEEDPEAPRLRWMLSHAAKNSPLSMRIEGVARSGAADHPNVVDDFIAGISELEAGRRPPRFSDGMLERTQRLIRPVGGRVRQLVFADSGLNAIRVTQQAAANADRFRLPAEYTEYGELDGRLDQIIAHKPPYEFCIYDPITDKPVPCLFAPDELDKVKELLQRRLRVSGLITYRRNDHRPTKVSVESWSPLPNEDGIPAVEEMHRMQIDLTGGRPSEEVIAELRRWSHA